MIHDDTIPYPDLNTLSPELREAVTNRASLNIFRMITHTPGLAPSFLTMASDLLQHNSLPATWRELCILRVGHRYESTYEVYQHNIIGKAVGLPDAALAAVEAGSADELDDEHAVIMQLTDVLLDDHTLAGPHLAQARNLLTLNQLADLVLTVGFYQLVCNFLNTFQVMPESRDAGQ
jgi:4-carboxymuconolactone decarboxylase